MGEMEKLKQDIVDIGLKLVKTGMTRGTCGNISSRIKGENSILITPSGIPFQDITPRDILLVDFQGNSRGAQKPSVETPLHLAIYKNRDDVGGILHTHSLYALAVSSVKKRIPVFLDEIFSHIGGDIGITDYALPGSDELAYQVLKTLGDKNAVILRNHGAVSCGTSLQDAYHVSESVETICHIYILSTLLGNIRTLPNDGQAYQRAIFETKKRRL